MAQSFIFTKIEKIFGTEIPRSSMVRAADEGRLPSPTREKTGSTERRAWTIEDLPKIGELYGFLEKPERPAVISVFTSKGGVLKTSLTVNIARLAALHNIKTIVVGLDFQGDVTAALGFDNGLDNSDLSFEEAQAQVESIRGLYDFEVDDVPLKDLIQDTDVPTLKFIPETPELQHLERAISAKNRREFWLQDNIVSALKKDFDLIIFDCSPNWNHLVTNAIAAADVLISPLECKINQYNNYGTFRYLMDAFKRDVQLDFVHVHIPTRLSPTRKLSADIKSWFLKNVPNCLDTSIRESIQGEEAMAKQKSIPEHAPTSIPANEMREVVRAIFIQLETALKRHAPAPAHRIAQSEAQL